MAFSSPNQIRATNGHLGSAATRTRSVAQLNATGAPIPGQEMPALPPDSDSLAAIAKALLAYVTLATAQTITGLKTFNRGAAAPFAVDAASLLVANLNADKLDGFDESAFGKLADAEAVTGVWDFVNGLKIGSAETALLYDEGTFVLTGTGFTVNPSGTARYVKWGSLVSLYVPALGGTSNAATFTLTGLPAAITPTRGAELPVVIVDNGAAAFGRLVLGAGSTTLIVSPSAASGTWTASGAKELVYTSITYNLL